MLHATFRLPRKTLYIALGSLPLPVAGAAAFLTGAALPDHPIEHPLFARLVPGGICLGFCLLSIYLAIAWRNTRLIIDGRRVIVSGVFYAVEFDLSEVMQARWKTNSRSLKLAAGGKRCCITFPEYEMPSTIAVIEHFRRQIPESVQSGWPWFEYRYVRRDLQADTPGKGKVLESRRRMDRIVLPGATAILITGLAVAFQFQNVRVLLPISAVAALVAGLRYSCSRKGHYAPTISAAYREQPELKGILVMLPITVAGVMICRLASQTVPDALGWFAGGILIAMGALLMSSALRERRLRRQIEREWHATAENGLQRSADQPAQK